MTLIDGPRAPCFWILGSGFRQRCRITIWSRRQRFESDINGVEVTVCQCAIRERFHGPMCHCPQLSCCLLHSPYPSLYIKSLLTSYCIETKRNHPSRININRVFTELWSDAWPCLLWVLVSESETTRPVLILTGSMLSYRRMQWACLLWVLVS